MEYQTTNFTISLKRPGTRLLFMELLGDTFLKVPPSKLRDACQGV
jgi:hypothetical protein